jgi:hypothetical protein
MLQGGTELGGEPPVGNENKTNHRNHPAGAVGAPHERAPIMTIPRPSARAFPANVAARYAPLPT